jgi:hypothetical protein
MSVWFVGNAPVAHCRLPSNNASGAVNSNTEKLSGADQKVFFMKSQIFSGQVHPPRGVEFAWLTKQELADYMDPKYYQSVKDCLTEQ